MVRGSGVRDIAEIERVISVELDFGHLSQSKYQLQAQQSRTAI